ncbi:MAG: hypothetical protein J6B04_01490 [Clostridia bacterium]|nr:hypothetical protein [Clostridia bacterium]
MKTKNKIVLTLALVIALTVAVILGVVGLNIPQTFKGVGVYGDNFTVLAEEQEGGIGTVKHIVSTDKAYLLLATSINVDVDDYKEVGYKITKNSEAEQTYGSNKYYTGITIKVESGGNKTYTMQQIFADAEVVGMIVAEVEYDSTASYKIVPYMIANDGTVENGSEVATTPHEHTEETLERKEPTYTETGLTAGKWCPVCKEILEAQTVIPALYYEYTETLKVEVENTTYVNSYTQEGYGTGVILGGTTDQTKVSFIVKASESKTVNVSLYALIKVDASYSAVASDRFELTSNGVAADLSAGTIAGSNNATEWWKGLYTNNMLGKITLQEGENLIVLSLKTNEMNLDYITFTAEDAIVEDPYTYNYESGMKVELEETNFNGATVQQAASGSILGITDVGTMMEFTVITEEETNVEVQLYGLIKVDASYSNVAGHRFAITVNGATADLSAGTLVGSDNADRWWEGSYATSTLGVIKLAEGKNVINLSLKTNEINLDYVILTTSETAAEEPYTYDYESGMKVELEDTNFSGATIQSAASGSILGITNVGTTMEFTVITEEETNVEVQLYGLIKVDASYSNIAGHRFAITVNGVATDLSAGTIVGSDNADRWWEGSYATSTLGVIKLSKGKNIINISLKTNEINLDYITLTTSEAVVEEPFTFNYESGMKVELEDTNVSGAAIQSGYGTGTIVGSTSSKTTLQFTIIATEETTVEVLLNALIKVDAEYSAVTGDRFALTVNGNEVDLSASTLTGSENEEKWWEGSYASNSLGTITLTEGKNVITLSLKSNEINLDYIQLG